MDRSSQLNFGVDVGKHELVIASRADQHIIKIANQPEAIGGWLKRLPPDCRIGMEATGVYHLQLADLAHAAGHQVYVFNPRTVAVYLKSLRSRGKTDILGARGIVRYVQNEADEHPLYTPSSATERSVQTLLHRRHQVVKQRAALRMSCQSLDELTRAPFDPLLAAFDQCLRKIDTQLRQLVRADGKLHALATRLRSIPGVGPLISTALALRLSRHPYRNSDALVAALGMDPRPHQSGVSDAPRHLSKQGNGEERRLIYMAAVSACRCALWRERFEQLIARGLPSTAAHCIIARKLLRIAFAINKKRQAYSVEALSGNCHAT